MAFCCSGASTTFLLTLPPAGSLPSIASPTAIAPAPRDGCCVSSPSKLAGSWRSTERSVLISETAVDGLRSFTRTRWVFTPSLSSIESPSDNVVQVCMRMAWSLACGSAMAPNARGSSGWSAANVPLARRTYSRRTGRGPSCSPAATRSHTFRGSCVVPSSAVNSSTPAWVSLLLSSCCSISASPSCPLPLSRFPSAVTVSLLSNAETRKKYGICSSLDVNCSSAEAGSSSRSPAASLLYATSSLQ
mmetsp:Transcript_1955/g.7031  ORF Transcript_1955/g.7031 Transcript_1955/m.7031 type:complete len:246 (-) Transcript_1955:221-958(-)